MTAKHGGLIVLGVTLAGVGVAAYLYMNSKNYLATRIVKAGKNSHYDSLITFDRRSNRFHQLDIQIYDWSYQRKIQYLHQR